ncbi:hypothetical protein AcV5_000270 [Taiwanofungus camphoratus]|nr:hypothetical protein AcV5_000270 [Antrodia cinnamomea]
MTSTSTSDVYQRVNTHNSPCASGDFKYPPRIGSSGVFSIIATTTTYQDAFSSPYAALLVPQMQGHAPLSSSIHAQPNIPFLMHNSQQVVCSSAVTMGTDDSQLSATPSPVFNDRTIFDPQLVSTPATSPIRGSHHHHHRNEASSSVAHYDPHVFGSPSNTPPRPAAVQSVASYDTVGRVPCCWGEPCCGVLLDDVSPAGIARHLKDFHFDAATRPWSNKNCGPCEWWDLESPCPREMNYASYGKHIASVHLRSTARWCPYCQNELGRADSFDRHVRHYCPRSPPN